MTNISWYQNLPWHAWVLTALDHRHLSICMTWNCCGKLLKDRSSFRKSDSKLFVFYGLEGFLSSLLNLLQFWGSWSQNPEGRLNTLRKISKPTHFVCEVFLVDPSLWPSFIEIGEMACITPAWSSHENSLEQHYHMGKFFVLKTLAKTKIPLRPWCLRHVRIRCRACSF